MSKRYCLSHGNGWMDDGWILTCWKMLNYLIDKTVNYYINYCISLISSHWLLCLYKNNSIIFKKFAQHYGILNFPFVVCHVIVISIWAFCNHEHSCLLMFPIGYDAVKMFGCGYRIHTVHNKKASSFKCVFWNCLHMTLSSHWLSVCCCDSLSSCHIQLSPEECRSHCALSGWQIICRETEWRGEWAWQFAAWQMRLLDRYLDHAWWASSMLKSGPSCHSD